MLLVPNFLADAFFAVDLLAGVFVLAAGFFPACFFELGFFAVGFFAAGFFRLLALLLAISSSYFTGLAEVTSAARCGGAYFNR